MRQGMAMASLTSHWEGIGVIDIITWRERRKLLTRCLLGMQLDSDNLKVVELKTMCGTNPQDLRSFDLPLLILVQSCNQSIAWFIFIGLNMTYIVCKLQEIATHRTQRQNNQPTVHFFFFFVIYRGRTITCSSNAMCTLRDRSHRRRRRPAWRSSRSRPCPWPCTASSPCWRHGAWQGSPPSWWRGPPWRGSRRRGRRRRRG